MGKLARLIVQPQDVLYDLLGIFQPKVGDYYCAIRVAPIWITVADYGANKLTAYYYPIFRKMRFDQIAICIVGAGGAGAKARIGLYDDKDFYPNSLLFDAGEVDASTTGDKIISIDKTLDVGAYWIAFILNDATIDLQRTGYALSLMRDITHTVLCSYYITQTYGALPSTFPTGASKDIYLYRLVMRVAEVF